MPSELIRVACARHVRNSLTVFPNGDVGLPMEIEVDGIPFRVFLTKGDAYAVGQMLLKASKDMPKESLAS